MQETKTRIGEWAEQYKLTNFISKNQINKMVRSINKGAENNIKMFEDANEVEREFLFSLRKMFADRVKPIETLM